MKYKIVQHQFGQNDTVAAVLRKYNNYTPNKEVLRSLTSLYISLNNHAHPNLAYVAKIPVFDPEGEYDYSDTPQAD